ncbi:hypothetical protein MBLNU459_g3307t2 [Dothideomycetes sp. NU459]
MPHNVSQLMVTELHPFFAAEVSGVDFSKPVDSEVYREIYGAITKVSLEFDLVRKRAAYVNKYGVCVFRQTSLDDSSHIQFASLFGELDDVSPYTKLGKKNRLSTDQLFDVSNLNEDGTVAKVTSHRAAMNRGNNLFHVDSSFNPRRGSYSLLRAHKLPPPGTGGNTEYCDTRQAYDDLPEDLKKELLDKDYVACHSLYHSRKTASPDFLANVEPLDYPMSRHRLVQRHEPSGRMNLYIASHVHHIEDVSPEKSKELIQALYQHATQPKYVVSIEWQSNGDLILWDNTCFDRGHPYGQPVKANPEELRYPAGFAPASERYTSQTAIKQFSAGRGHILALSDSCRIWSWSNIDQAALHVRFLTVELKETTRESEIGHIKKVVAGWNKSAALVVGTGIVVWDSLSREPDETESEEDSALVLETAVVPRTVFQRMQSGSLSTTLQRTHLDEEIGEVQNFIVLEHYVIFNTHVGKVFASKILWSEDEHSMSEVLEISLNAGEAELIEEESSAFAADVQGSFRRFAIFTRSGAVLVSDEDSLDAHFASTGAQMRFKRIPSLQNSHVISLAFGDYHFHALHSPGYITSYGSEPKGCGCLGLGGHGDPEGRLRGLRYQGIGGDGRLVPHAYSTGRRIWFEEDKKRWITFLTSGGKDPEEARERIRMCADVRVQGEVSEWVEQEGSAWDERFRPKRATNRDGDGDGTGAYFALSVTAAGWHSGALVLVNEDEVTRTREGCIVRPSGYPKPFDMGNEENEKPTAENSGLLDRTLDRVTDHARWFLGLPSAAEEQRAADAQPNHLRPFTNPVNHGAENEDGYKYAWADDSFPRLRLSDGREMPGTIDFHEWRYGRPEWDLSTEL